MANKRINDLQARSDFDETCNVAVDDASQSWRATGAQILDFIGSSIDLITGRTSDTDPQSVDMLMTYDDSAAAMKKVSKGDLLKLPVRAVTGTDTVTVEDGVITADATSGAFTITLPSASSCAGRKFLFKNLASTSNAVTIARAGSDTIDGATSITMTIQYESIELISLGGTAWAII